MRATPERLGAVLAGQNGRHQRASERTTARVRSRPWASSSARLAAVRAASPRQERQQLGERAEGRPHQDRQSAQPDEACCREDQRKLDPVHGVSPDLGCRTPEEGLRERAGGQHPERGRHLGALPWGGPRRGSPTYRRTACPAARAGPSSRTAGPRASTVGSPSTGACGTGAPDVSASEIPRSITVSSPTRSQHATARARPEAPPS